MAKNREITECFKRYRSLKKDEYTIMLPNMKTLNNTGEAVESTVHTFIPKHSDKDLHFVRPLKDKEVIANAMKMIKARREQEKNKSKEQETDDKNSTEGFPVQIPQERIVKKELVDRLSPDNIDSTEFWKEANKSFPLFSICGHPVKDKDEANKTNNIIAQQCGALKCLQDRANSCLRHYGVMSMLEIGPGFGNIYEMIKDQDTINYSSIDVYPLFDHPNMYLTDGKTIPEHIDKLDIVYSINVFQHLSKEQRSSYYSQIYDRLNPGGMFIFSMFVKAPMNEKLPLWGCKDEDGRCYTMFFRQLTEVDELHELMIELSQVGFSTKIITPADHLDKHNVITFSCIK